MNSEETETLFLPSENPYLVENNNEFHVVRVQNIPYWLPWTQLLELISLYGFIHRYKIVKREENRGYAFIEFVSEKDVENVVSTLHGLPLVDNKEQTLEVYPAFVRNKKMETLFFISPRTLPFTNVYFGNLPFHFTEIQLRQLCAKENRFGPIYGVHVRMKKKIYEMHTD